ncbi:hypothetical protein [Halobacillus sp. H74]|uniref:hypothetical protein n=1 Tax=Halobacillus sp. H74 TaxID=3457436 RepID=UPI003FCDDD57
MSHKAKVILMTIIGLGFIGYVIYEFIAGDVTYRTYKLIGVVAVIGYILYTAFSSKEESEL